MKFNKFWIVLGLCVIAYGFANIYYYYNVGQYGLSDSPDKWGQYGDFIGGSLNPLLAIINIGALIYLTYKISDVEGKRASENINAQKTITLTQMRHEAVVKFSAKIEDLIFTKGNSNTELHKAFNDIEIQLHLFNKYNSYLFNHFLFEETLSFYYINFEKIIKEIIKYHLDIENKGKHDLDKMKQLHEQFGIRQNRFIQELNQFILDELKSTEPKKSIFNLQ